MKRKFLALALILAVIFSISGAAFAASKKNDEKKRMGIFISNFTELGMYEFDIEEEGPNFTFGRPLQHGRADPFRNWPQYNQQQKINSKMQARRL